MTNIWDEVARIDSGNPSAIDKAIRRLAKSGRKYALQVHAALVAAVEHSVKHSDASKVTMLWETVSGHANAKSIQVWLETYTHLTRQKDAKGVVKFLGRDPDTGDKSYIFLIEGADVPFFLMEKNVNREEQAWEFEKKFYALLAVATKKAQDNKLSEADAKFFATVSAALKGKVKADKPANDATPATIPVPVPAPAPVPAAA